ncbi:hypothetical protein VULLAG_LOCUS6677 [Vulpes lagopus]
MRGEGAGPGRGCARPPEQRRRRRRRQRSWGCGAGGGFAAGRLRTTQTPATARDLVTKRRRYCCGARARGPAAPRTAGQQGAGAAGRGAPDDGFGRASMKKCHMSQLVQEQTCPVSCWVNEY